MQSEVLLSTMAGQNVHFGLSFVYNLIRQIKCEYLFISVKSLNAEFVHVSKFILRFTTNSVAVVV